MTPVLWACLGLVIALLVFMTWQLLSHDPRTCRVCVERRASRDQRDALRVWLP